VKILITTVPFGEFDPTPLELLRAAVDEAEFVINPIGRKLKEAELAELAPEFDVLIAGTEQISRRVMEAASRLKLISRVGIGLDSVDLHAARELGITVSYTPDAPAPAVAELTVAHILNLLRYLPVIDRKMRGKQWHRIMGERLALQTVGIVGTGRIGTRVLRHLQGFAPARILVNDLKPDAELYAKYNAEAVDKETLYRESDIISLHVPLTRQTRHMIGAQEMAMMKPGVRLINTARGGIIHEGDLYEALVNNRIAGAAIDVFEEEPYAGALAEVENCFISCHMGSMTQDCRAEMEIRATEEALRFVRGEPLSNVVPEYEYEL
jgi:D-3-phosphoglycerate dehydrogenase